MCVGKFESLDGKGVPTSKFESLDGKGVPTSKFEGPVRRELLTGMFERLVRRGVLTGRQLQDYAKECETSGKYPEEVLLEKGVPRHEILFCLSEYYGYPFIEYDEGTVVSQKMLRRFEIPELRSKLFVPLSSDGDSVDAIVRDPVDPSVRELIENTTGARKINYLIALPSDIIKIIDNSLDLNPGFPLSAGRTPLAKVRTFLAERRSMLACYRTSFARGRTGLAFIRTGVSFITIALLFLRIFGIGYLTILECLLLAAGIVTAVDGLLWYVPARKTGKRVIDCSSTRPTWGTTVLEVCNPGDNPVFRRTSPVEGAAELRDDWCGLSPVMRRRFLAGDRTDLAEERTALASYRTAMARARTGLAFARTGISFIGIGIAFFRQFASGPWSIFDASLIAIGIAMAAEGFYWYVPGRKAGIIGFESVRKAEDDSGIWDFIFPPAHREKGPGRVMPCPPPVGPSHAPGIWATTGLALERTVLADRRNIMARLRTIMARSRTGMAFVRTGMSISAVGMGLLVYFGMGNIFWAVSNILMVGAGIALIADGLYWHLPAERARRQFPYCYADMEISIPDYGRPARRWGRVVFSHDDI